MRLPRWSAPLFLALLFAPATALAAKPAPARMSHMLRDAVGPTIPASWAGIYSYTDTTYDCETLAVTGTDADNDTLCAESSFEDSTFTCTGTATETDADLTCTYSFDLFPGCSATVTGHIVATKSGDQVASTFTITTVFTPTGCAFQPDQCEKHSRRMTRILPPPPTCPTTPTQPATWGRLKIRYR